MAGCLRIEAEARAEAAQKELLKELSATDEGDGGKSRHRKRKARARERAKEQLETDPAGDQRLASLRYVVPPQQSTADPGDDGGDNQGVLGQGGQEGLVVVTPVPPPDADALLCRVRELEDLAVHKDQHIHILEERCSHLGDQCAELSRLNQEV